MKEEEAWGHEIKFHYHVKVNGAVRAGFLSEKEALEWAGEHGGEVWKAARNPRWAGREAIYGNRERDAIVEAVLGGMTYREAVKEFGCSIGYVHKLISEHRGKEAGKK